MVVSSEEKASSQRIRVCELKGGAVKYSRYAAQSIYPGTTQKEKQIAF